MDGLKICTKCGTEKSLDQFYDSKRLDRTKVAIDGKYSRCKVCVIIDSKQWAQNNVEKRKATNLKCRLKLRFGITVEDYERLFDNQDGLCAICRGDSSNRETYDIDHDHSTGKIRGLLCHKCNKAIGLMNDNITSLSSAINYLSNGGYIG